MSHRPATHSSTSLSQASCLLQRVSTVPAPAPACHMLLGQFASCRATGSPKRMRMRLSVHYTISEEEEIIVSTNLKLPKTGACALQAAESKKLRSGGVKSARSGTLHSAAAGERCPVRYCCCCEAQLPAPLDGRHRGLRLPVSVALRQAQVC